MMYKLLAILTIGLLVACGGSGSPSIPQTSYPQTDNDDIVIIEDEVIVVEFTPDLSYGPHLYDLTAPVRQTDLPVIMLVHGGGWFRGSKEAFLDPGYFGIAEYYAKKGHVVVAINYTLGEHPMGLNDIILAKDYFSAQYGRPVIMLGVSAGGHLATLAAQTSEENVLGVVSVSGVYDFTADVGAGAMPKIVENYLAGTAPEEASPVYKELNFPLLMLHGIEDPIVYVTQCLIMQNKFGPECLVIDGVGHNVVIMAYPEVEEFIETLSLEYLQKLYF